MKTSTIMLIYNREFKLSYFHMRPLFNICMIVDVDLSTSLTLQKFLSFVNKDRLLPITIQRSELNEIKYTMGETKFPNDNYSIYIDNYIVYPEDYEVLMAKGLYAEYNIYEHI